MIYQMIKNHVFMYWRSGRYGKKGNAINFVLAKDSQYVKDLETFYNTFISELPANIKISLYNIDEIIWK